jgi:plasmid stabilization system protein ParE
VINNHRWWAKHRSVEQAERWINGIDVAVSSLRRMPERFGFAPEKDLAVQGLRQMLFGIGKRPTHRVVFAIDGNEVVVLRVRGVAQDVLGAGDLTE